MRQPYSCPICKHRMSNEAYSFYTCPEHGLFQAKSVPEFVWYGKGKEMKK